MAETTFKIDEEEERKNIIDRYEKGREKVLQGEGIADYEDPTNELYQVTDRYGFIHDYKLPEKLTKHENQIRELEMKRREKWCKMIANWNYYKTKKFDKLRERVFKGIPNALRGHAWLLLLDVPRIKQENENRYNEMYNLGKQYSKEVRQIDLDVNRTFRNNEMFRERYNTKQQELFRVLVAYSVYNSEIGYCQGMSQLAGLLLLFTSEEDTFWALDRLMTDEKYAMHGFFVPGFPKLQRFAKHHDLILKKFLNKVYKHFRKFDIESTLYTLKWFFQCFLDRVPFSLTLRLWDCFMVDGERILTCMSYTLLKLHKKTILRKSMDELIPFLQIDLEKDFGYHDDEAINELQKSIQDLHKYKMDVPKEKPSDQERPSRPFGLISQKAETISIINDDRSVVESINCKPFNDENDDLSNLSKNTSRTGSNIDVNEYKEDIIDESDLMNDLYKRKLSVYDNVDLNESFKAAKRLINEESLTTITLDNKDDANLKQFKIDDNHLANNHQAINQNSIDLNDTKQLNGQNNYIQEKKNGSTFFIDNLDESLKSINLNNNNQKSKDDNDLKDEENEQFKRQTKKTSSFKFLKRKSSIPTMKRNDSQRKSLKNNINKDNHIEKSSQNLDKKSIEFNRSQSFINGNHNDQKLNNNDQIKTPNKISLIPRLNSSTKSTPKNELSFTESDRLNSTKPSNIPINNNLTIKNLTSSNDENLSTTTTSLNQTKIKIYVPYAQINSQNNSRTNSKNSLTSSTNSINLNNGANGLNQLNKKQSNDLNKITINVNQKFNSNESNSMQRKSYLPTIDT